MVRNATHFDHEADFYSASGLLLIALLTSGTMTAINAIRMPGAQMGRCRTLSRLSLDRPSDAPQCRVEHWGSFWQSRHVSLQRSDTQDALGTWSGPGKQLQAGGSACWVHLKDGVVSCRGENKTSSDMQVYGASKLYNIMVAKALNEKLKGTGVEAFSAHTTYIAKPPLLDSWTDRTRLNSPSFGR